MENCVFLYRFRIKYERFVMKCRLCKVRKNPVLPFGRTGKGKYWENYLTVTLKLQDLLEPSVVLMVMVAVPFLVPETK